MSIEIERAFERMGARARVSVARPPRGQLARVWNGRSPRDWRGLIDSVRIDVARDKRGEYFTVARRDDVEVKVLDVRPGDRHLLIATREPLRGRESESKFLCGHDERAWFVAAIPEAASVATVQDAKDALKPSEVWDAMEQFRVPRHQRDWRRTDAFVRQGEWFFIPRPKFVARENQVLKNEQIRRGNGKPHVCQFLVRAQGELVWFNTDYPNGLTAEEFRKLPRRERSQKQWQQMMRNAQAHVKGYVRHPDHKTVWLECWHEVVMNTETRSRAMQHVAFLD
jgi:hypothetical protein